MSNALTPPSVSNRPSNASAAPPKRQRILACTLCQQRKIKCNRKFPCINCVKSRAECIPGTQVIRPRRSKLYDRTLLDRIRKYEDLLRQNNIPFEPLNLEREDASPNAEGTDGQRDERTLPLTPDESVSSPPFEHESTSGARNVFHFMNQAYRDPDCDSDSSQDDLRELTVRNAWKAHGIRDQHILFGSRLEGFDLYDLHPDPVQIFKLWQVYADNVNPLLKVIHIPSTQPRIIEATSNLMDIEPTFEALMFGMYSMAVLSMDDQDCQSMFNSSREDLLSRFRSGCQEALWRSGFLATEDRECLIALLLYLISSTPVSVPRTLSPVIGVAIRIAKRMGIHRECFLSKGSIFEAEMRRRLWWPLMLLDSRMAGLSGANTLSLTPSWDCRIPLNINDADLRPDMKIQPTPKKEPTDATPLVLISEIGEFIRYCTVHLEFWDPALKPIAKYTLTEENLNKLETRLEDQYLKLCNTENPAHLMALWSTRAEIAKLRLLQSNIIMASASNRSDSRYDATASCAMTMLQLNTNIMTSPLTKAYHWHNLIYFPFPAYYQLAQDLKRRPYTNYAEQAWKIVSDNWAAWFNIHITNNNSIFQLMSKIILQAWDAYSSSKQASGQSVQIPGIVASIKEQLVVPEEMALSTHMEGFYPFANMPMNQLPMPMRLTDTSFDYNAQPSGEMQESWAWMNTDMSSGATSLEQALPGEEPTQLDWNEFLRVQGWRNFQ